MENQRSLEHFPIMFFASIMGMFGLSLALKKAAQFDFFSAYFLNLHFGVGLFSSIVFVVFLLLYLFKTIFYFQYVKEEFSHPIKINFFGALSISTLMFALFLKGRFYCVDFALLLIALLFQGLFSLIIVRFWILNHLKPTQLSPAWFIPMVGNLIVPLVAHSIDPQFNLMILFYFLSVGTFFWIILSTLIFSRLLFEENLPVKFLPTLFILIAPPSILAIDLNIFFPQNIFSILIFCIALFYELLLFFLLPNFKQVFNAPFALSWWAFCFPLCAFSLSAFELKQTTFGFLALCLAFLSVLFVGIQTLIAIYKKQICQAEK